MLAQHKDQQALGRCRAIDSPLARILAELIHNAHGPIEDMPEVAQIAGRREALLLGTHLGTFDYQSDLTTTWTARDGHRHDTNFHRDEPTWLW